MTITGPAIARTPSPSSWTTSAPSTSGRARTPRGPTARRSDWCRLSSASGPTSGSTRPPPIEPPRCRPGSGTTTERGLTL